MGAFINLLIEGRLYAQIFGILMILIMMYAERSTPEKIPLWTFVFMALPILGTLAYLMIGQTFYAEHTFKIKGVSDKALAKAEKFDEYLIESDITTLDEDTTKVIRAIKSVGGSVYSNNNDIQLFTDGNDFFEKMFEDIRNAKHFIHLEYFILRNDQLGNELMELITEKAHEGLDVRLVIDYLGIKQKELMEPIHEFRAAGGKFTTFHRMATVLLSPKKNNRNHRKLTIIDGDIAYCGGYNIGDEYLGKGEFGNWRDSGVRIRGGGCIPINIRFLKDWNYAYRKSTENIDMEKMFRKSMFTPYGEERMQLVSGGPDIAWKNPVRLQYLEMIRVAKRKIWIHTPYLIPNDSLVDGLLLAAASGVDVRIIIPDRPDHYFVYWNNLYFANKLMEGGVRVYHYNNGFVHSKTIVVDDFFCSVGSANMDDRSLVHNFESNAMIYSERIAKEMTEAFEKDLEFCTEYSCEEYKKRTPMMKLKISISKMFKTLS